MSKTAFLHLHDHHDPIWNKAFIDHFRDDEGQIIRSYSDREELQFSRWFDLLEDHRYCIMIEITADLREFLDRNPDRVDQVKRLADEGKLEFLGGGTTIVDYNLIHGESIYRNFLYSFLWLDETFGIHPSVPDAFDTFGLSAQLPQILRQFGFSWLPIYLRVFGIQSDGTEIDRFRSTPVQPYWRGLDGTVICIARDFPEHEVTQDIVFVNYQYRPCPVCSGEGCRFCSYSGMNRLLESPGTSADEALRRFAESENQSCRLTIHDEETIKTRNFLRELESTAEKHDVKLKPITYGQIQESWAAELVDAARTGTVAEEQIDLRREGNPLCTGCYVTRGSLKRVNRELEYLLMASEIFGSFARRYGYRDQRSAIRSLWEQMNLVHAHDAITGNHPDAPFEELQRVQRTVRSGAGRRLMAACEAIDIAASIPGVPGTAVRVFNPLNWDVAWATTEVVLRPEEIALPDGAEVTSWTVESPDGMQPTILDWERVRIWDRMYYRLRVAVRNLPSFGFATLFCAPAFDDANSDDPRHPGQHLSEDTEFAGQQEYRGARRRRTTAFEPNQVEGSGTIQNEFYEIRYGESGIEAIRDRRTDRVVAGSGTLDLIAEDDIGSLWDRLKKLDVRFNLVERSDLTVDVFEGEFSKLVINGRLRNPIEWDIPKRWSMELITPRGTKGRRIEADEVRVVLRSLSWRHEVLLAPGCTRIDVRTTLECDSENVRIHVPFHLGFTTSEDAAVYGIPYGSIERPSYVPRDEIMHTPDGIWPAVDWVAVEHPEHGYTCAILNRGIPGNRFIDGTFELHLHRTALLNPHRRYSAEENGERNPLARELEPQVYEYSIVSGPGGITTNRIVHQACERNAVFGAITCDNADRRSKRPLPSRHSFLRNHADNVIVPIIKCAEDGDGFVLRMTEVYGEAGFDEFDGSLAAEAECDPMETHQRPIEGKIGFRPFEIKSVRATESL